MTGDNKASNIREEVIRGEECLRAAEHLLEGGFFNDSVSRAYYAAFHWARAVLLTRGLEPRSHRGVIQLLGLHFVKEGQLGEDAAASLAQLETYRELSDCHTSAVFTEQQARAEINRARAFKAACAPLLPGE